VSKYGESLKTRQKGLKMTIVFKIEETGREIKYLYEDYESSETINRVLSIPIGDYVMINVDGKTREYQIKHKVFNVSNRIFYFNLII